MVSDGVAKTLVLVSQYCPAAALGLMALAKSIAPAMLTSPAPTSKAAPFFSAVYMRIDLTRFGVKLGLAERIIAAAPATAGAAILVPLSFRYPVPICRAGYVMTK